MSKYRFEFIRPSRKKLADASGRYSVPNHYTVSSLFYKAFMQIGKLKNKNTPEEDKERSMEKQKRYDKKTEKKSVYIFGKEK